MAEAQALVDLLSSGGGWGVSVVFLWLYLSERRASATRDTEIFTLLKQQTRLLGGKED